MEMVDTTFGGDFERAGLYERTHLAHIDANGQVDQNFNPQLDAPVNTLALKDNLLFIGGNFTEVEESPRKYLAVYDLEADSFDNFLPEPNNRVYALATYQSYLLLGGWFGAIGDSSTQNVAMIDLNTGQPETIEDLSTGWVYTFDLQGDTLYGGGEWPSHLFAIDLSQKRMLSWKPQISGFGFGQRVNAIVRRDSLIYFGGYFGSVNGESRNNLAAVSLSGNVTPFNPRPNAEVFALRVVGDDLMIGGDFTAISEQEIPHLAKWDIQRNFLSSWRVRPDWAIREILPAGDNMLIGGEFEILQYQQRNNAFAMDLGSGALLDWNPPDNFLVISKILTSPANDLVYLSGNSSTVAAVDAVLGSPVPGWEVNANNEISAIALDPRTSNLYLAGAFTEINGEARNRLAAVDGQGSLLPFFVDVDNQVTTLAISPDTNFIYFAGTFNDVNSVFKGKLAAVNTQGQLVGWKAEIENFLTNQFRRVFNIVPHAGRVYLSGNFERVNGDTIPRLAAVDAISGERIDWHPRVKAQSVGLMMPLGNGLLIRGTSMTEAGGGPVEHLAHLGFQSGRQITNIPDLGFSGKLPSGGFIQITSISAMVPYESGFIAGGDFRFLEGNYHPNLATVDLQLEEGPSFEGIERIIPRHGGNTRDVTIQIFGSGLLEGSEFFLRRNGTEDRLPIPGSVNLSGKSAISATFDLAGATLGLWDLILNIPGNPIVTLEEAFEVVPGEEPSPWADIMAPDFLLANREERFFLTIGNRGNSDAHGVPVLLTLSPNLELQDLPMQELEIDPLFPEYLDSIPEYVEIDSLNQEPYPAKVYIFLIPNVPANSSRTFSLKVVSTDPGPFYANAWANAPWYGSPLRHWVGDCHDKIISLGIGFIPFAGCAFGTIDVVTSPIIDRIYNVEIDNAYRMNYLQVLGQTALSCAGDFVSGGLAGPILNTVNTFMNVTSAIDAGITCFPFPDQDGASGETVGSYDPNDKLGPHGQGGGDWLNTQRTLPYTVRFENDPEATAPAKEVIIRDTLDITVFDLSSLDLLGFSIADSFYTVTSRGSSLDKLVDLRPRLPYQVRTEVSLNEASGELSWSFQTIDPTNGEPVTHPLEGFLPPNSDSISGTGSLLFELRVHDTLSNGREIGNRAAIYFDFNEPIITNTWTLKADNQAPLSMLSPLPDTQFVRTFDLSWEGEDQGSGIRYYDLLYRTHPDSSWILWERTGGTSVSFTGENNQHYEFAILAIDTAQNQENKILLTEAQTYIKETITSTTDLPLSRLNIYPNPTTGKLNVEIGSGFRSKTLEILDILGHRRISRVVPEERPFRMEIDLSDLAPGVYLLRWYEKGRGMVKRIVRN